ncbi:hypothetical protein [uncultured Fusobacterium sp.]|uniref:hypothetical protein n=1 Tax=uncultured Fusobacterium sp. TaxID=159267 RepID=UPI0025FDAA0A|nr:hypothetical protein [uncultured Fusobacterium sp.]
MFNSEREMQDIFVSLLKERKTCGLIFEEVGNRNFFFRTDVVEYKDRNNIIGYELKLDDFKKVIEQSIKTLELFDKSYIVIPDTSKCYEKLMLILNNHKEKEKIKNIGIIILNKEKYKVIKSANNSTRNYNNKYTSTLVQDLIIRGYHKAGENNCKNYK